MKKTRLAAMVMLMAISIAGCGTDNKQNTGNDTEVTENISETGNSELDEILKTATEYDPLEYVTLPEYKGIEINTFVSDDEVEEEIAAKLSEEGSFDEIKEGTVKSGDTVNINFVGKMNGVEFEGGSSNDFPLEIGSNSFIPGFEDGLIGVNVGETVDLDLTFPDPYLNNPDYAGKPVVFTVTVNYIQGEYHVPELNDEFVNTSTNGECKDVKSYKEKIKTDIYNEKAGKIQDDAFIKVLDTAEVSDCPEFLVELMKLRLDSSYKAMAKEYGSDDFEKFVTESFQMTMDEYNEQIAQTAKTYVEQQLVTEAIAAKENITISDEEYEQELTQYLEGNNVTDRKEMEKIAAESYGSKLDSIIKEAIILDKVLAVIKDNVVEVKDVPPAETEVPLSQTEEAQ